MTNAPLVARPRRLASIALASAVLVFPLLAARADEAPSPNSPDRHCTLEEQCPHGVFCAYSVSPTGSAATPEQQIAAVRELDCVNAAKKKGLEPRCRSGNNMAGQHLYCPKGETGTAAKKSGCGK